MFYLIFTMDVYLDKHNIPYKIVNINNTYRFEIDHTTFHYIKNCGVKQHHYIIIYITPNKFEEKYTLLKNKINLLGFIEETDLYKCEKLCDNFNKIIEILDYFKLFRGTSNEVLEKV
jgi:hypothetical protein